MAPSNDFEQPFIDVLAKAARTNAGAPQVVLVGSNFLGIHLRNLLAHRMGGFFNVRFLTFIDLARTLARPILQNTELRPFTEGTEELLIQELCERIPEGQIFSQVKLQSGFHRALKSTFHDLLDGGIESFAGFEGKLAELNKLFLQHRSRYQSKWLTTADLIRAAAKGGALFSKAFQTDTLFCYGFYDLTSVQQDLLRAISKNSRICAWVPFTSLDPFFRQIGAEVMHLKLQLPPSIFALSAPAEIDEAEEVVRWILRALEQTPRPLHRIGILLRHPDEQLPTFAEVLDRSGIPYYREGGIPLLSTRAGRAFDLWLDLLKGTWTRSDVVRFLSIFPFSPRWLEEMSMGKPADWDLWTREAMVVSGEDQLFYRLSVLSKQYDKRGRAESQHIRKFVGFLQEWMLRWKIYEASNKPTWSRVGENMADAFLLPSVVETDAEAVEKICTSLADLDDFDTSPSLTTVTKVTRQRLQAASLQSNRQVFERDGLYVGSLVSARGIGFDMVCIPGLAERIFPAPPKPDPILLDSERTEINVATKGKLSLRSERLAEERSLFDLALRQGKFASLLSYARQSTGDQRERRPSAFFVRTVEKCRTRVASRALLKWTAVEQEPFIDVRDWVARDLGRRLVQKDLGVEEQLPSITPFAGPVRSWVNDRLGEKQWTSYDGVVHFDRGRALTSKAFSATEISTYATCPYRYYLRYVLNIRPVEKPDETKELRPIDRGDLIHEILFRLYSELREKRMLPLSLEGKAEAEARLKRIADVVFESAETRLPLGLQVLWSTEKNLILSDLHAFLSIDFEESANFVPLAFEVRFGRSVRNEYEDLTFSSDQPVSYALGDREESILLQGKIDRLDISPDRKRARIIDYKTGELKEARDEALNGGKSVQLPIYLSALGNLLPDVALEASEAVLWSTSYGGGFRRVSFSGQTFRAREIEFRKVLSTFKKGSGAGYFPPNPGDHLEHCEHCDFRGVCGWVIKSIAERKRNDPALSFIFDLESIP